MILSVASKLCPECPWLKCTFCIWVCGPVWLLSVGVKWHLRSGQASTTRQLFSQVICELGLRHLFSLPIYFHICPPSRPKIYFACLTAKCPCTWGTEARETSISSFFDTSPLASSVLRTNPAKSLSDFSSLGTFQSFKVTEKLALCKACCHLLLVSNLRAI